MIYTLTFNPSLDYIVTVPKFTCGMVNRTTEEIIFPGGKGINVSMVLKNLGFENTALGFYAGFTGMELKRLVADKGIHADFIPVEKGMTRINVKLRSEQESEINGQGPAIAASDIDKLYEKLDALQDGDILVMAGSIPDVMPQTMYMDIMKHLQGRNLKIVVDATRDLLANVLPFHPFLIKPNNHELGEIFGVEIREKEDVVTYAKKLQERGARNVLISMAGDGAVLVAEDGQGAPWCTWSDPRRWLSIREMFLSLLSAGSLSCEARGCPAGSREQIPQTKPEPGCSENCPRLKKESRAADLLEFPTLVSNIPKS